MEIATEMMRPLRKTERPFFTLAATDWEMAVWMDPAQRAKQIPNTGWIRLKYPDPQLQWYGRGRSGKKSPAPVWWARQMSEEGCRSEAHIFFLKVFWGSLENHSWNLLKKRIIINIWKLFFLHDTIIMRIIPIEFLGNVCIIGNVDEAFNFRTTERRN